MKNEKHPFRHKTAKRSGMPGQSRHYEKMKPEIEPALKNVFAKIGKPASATFVPDAFQLAALEAIKKTNCLVMAPTGAGKTWIAEQAIQSVFKSGGGALDCPPLKALHHVQWIVRRQYLLPG